MLWRNIKEKLKWSEILFAGQTLKDIIKYNLPYISSQIFMLKKLLLNFLLGTNKGSHPEKSHFIKSAFYIWRGSRTIAPEENCPPTLILTLTLNQTQTLTGGQFSRHPLKVLQKNLT